MLGQLRIVRKGEKVVSMHQLMESTTQNINAIHTKNIGLTEDVISNMQVFAKNLRKPADKFELVCNVSKVDMLTARDQDLIFPMVVTEDTFGKLVEGTMESASGAEAKTALKDKVTEIQGQQRRWVA